MGDVYIKPGGSGGVDCDNATAVSGDILIGKTAGVAGSDELVTGTMPNNGAISQALGINGSYAVPAGYHNGSGRVTQSIPVLGDYTINPSNVQQVIRSAGHYMTGNIVVTPSRILTETANFYTAAGPTTWQDLNGTPVQVYILTVPAAFKIIAGRANRVDNNGALTAVVAVDRLNDMNNTFLADVGYQTKTYTFKVLDGKNGTARIPVKYDGMYAVSLQGYLRY